MISSSRYRLPVRFWLQAIAVLAGLDAAVWLVAPEFVTSSAYDFARNVLPQRGWGAVFALAWASASVALAEQRFPARVRHRAAVFAVTLYGAAAATIGLSIAVLTFQGAEAALTGATKWWLPFAISIRILTRPTLDEDPA